MWEHLRTKPEELKKAITKQWKCKAFKHHADKNVLETDSEQQRHAGKEPSSDAPFYYSVLTLASCICSSFVILL